ncbi:hypothetical protein [Saccharopolyspora thermophila]|uniref:hypothetical protein n=1 Tax=Saccharopolyspora thermophila TaxID=89367 RepID=UPI0031F9A6A6
MPTQEAKMNRAAWVYGIQGLIYVWTGGEAVQVFGFTEYVRRLAGEVTDAHPFAVVPVRGFTSLDAFHAWCERGPGQQSERRCLA